MRGETNLSKLLRAMRPELHDEPYVFCALERPGPLADVALGWFREPEGVTLFLERHHADAAQLGYADVWALISLTVHSDLTAVGLLAAITERLAAAEISVNAISAFYHDHLFVPWERRHEALKLLHALGRASTADT